MVKNSPAEETKDTSQSPSSKEFDERAKAIFHSHATADGHLGNEEFKRVIHAIFTDSSGDSQVKLPSDEDLEKAFEAADDSGDGVVDEEEFLALLQDIKDGKVAGISHDNFFQNLEFSISMFPLTFILLISIFKIKITCPSTSSIRFEI